MERLNIHILDTRVSPVNEIETCVLQGCTLGPSPLYRICMNGIHKVIDKFTFILCADNTTLKCLVRQYLDKFRIEGNCQLACREQTIARCGKTLNSWY